MARKQKAKGFNKFLDFIGLVDAAPEEEFETEFDYNSGRSGKGRSTVRNDAFDDEFAEEPRMTRAPRRERPAPAQAASNNRFDADEGWDTAASRPDYAAERPARQARPQQSAPQGRSASRYGDSQRYGAQGRQSARFDQPEADSSYRVSSYGASSYGASGSYRMGGMSGASAFGNGGRRAESEMDMAFQQDAQRGQSNTWQRHQTVIFKLHSVDECKDVILALIEKKSVLLNLDELDSLQAQRTLDTMSGATFAIGATLSRASDRTWLITPSTVEVADSQMDDGRYDSRHYM